MSDSTEPAGPNTDWRKTTPMITVDFKQTTDLLAMFGGEPTTITLMTGPGHSGSGLYAVYDADPDGVMYLGQTDEEAVPEDAGTESIVQRVCQRVAELPNRDSPPDWPAAMLVTHEELASIVRQAICAPGNCDALPLSQAARDVLAERVRQINAEGYDPQHDDAHVNDEIAAMGSLFLMPEGVRDWDTTSTGYGHTLGEAMLPADWEAPRFGDRRDQLVKGTALGLAEIERLDRYNAVNRTNAR
ncbi:MAG: hypothetical protein EOO29_11460 [Comamonadaceae bacterium]|nr:MAG: hypothetical protein EOO29_11460 [Comamonadaceae bacterium]